MQQKGKTRTMANFYKNFYATNARVLSDTLKAIDVARGRDGKVIGRLMIGTYTKDIHVKVSESAAEYMENSRAMHRAFRTYCKAHEWEYFTLPDGKLHAHRCRTLT
jgi:hypothetical protein